MSDFDSLFTETEFAYGTTTVEILRGEILRPGVPVDALVSTDDNYLTMGSGVARALADQAGPCYVRAAQKQAPVKAGTVVVTGPYRLPKYGLDVQYVLHGTVIDYDTSDSSLEALVYRTTANCLEKAESLGLKSIIFPAFAAGSGELSMSSSARQMCSAIKVFLAQERFLERIYIVLHVPLTETGELDPGEETARQDKHRPFFQEANLVFGTPYDPASTVRQCRSFYGRREELGRLKAIVGMQGGDSQTRQNAVILGGPAIGKRTLLDQLFSWSRDPRGGLRKGQCVAQLTIGRVHQNTPSSFIYRRFLSAMAEFEPDKDLRKELCRARADSGMNCERFLDFLDKHPDRYQEVVFLVDRLPRLLQIDKDEDIRTSQNVTSFWADLDKLQRRVRFVYTARDDSYQTLLKERLEPLTRTFKQNIEVVRLTCLKEAELKEWVDALFKTFLGRSNGAPVSAHQLFEREAGLHPYLVALLGYALVETLKRDALYHPGSHPARYTSRAMQPYFRQALGSIERPRRQFFDLLLAACSADEQLELEHLAEAEGREKELAELLDEMPDPAAAQRYAELMREGDPRTFLHMDVLEALQTRGILVDADDEKTARFMAGSFGSYVSRFFGINAPRREDRRPRDVEITLLRPEPDEITALFKGTGATVDLARRPLPQDREREFLEDLYTCIRHWRNPSKYPGHGTYQSLEEAGNQILTQFTTGAIKAYLQDLPVQSTISLAVDHALKDIPWELMLEPAYTGSIRFRMGRSVVGAEPRRFGPPAGKGDIVKALLIDDPTGNIPYAAEEVQALAEMLRRDERVEPVLRQGQECTPNRLLADLASGQYGLIHYSGHSVYDGSQSAWLLAENKRITTDELTSALQMQPPALVFSSSCESAKAGEPGPVRYEFQTFDLVSAFLAAGTEAYVGTLWQVESSSAREFSLAFYEAFLSGESLGECVRRAKDACRQHERRELVSDNCSIPINWLAFVLYGNPHTRPGDLFPAMRDGDSSP